MKCRRTWIVMASLALALAAVPCMAQELVKATDKLVVHTPGTAFAVWDRMGYLQLSAPIEPATETYPLDEIIACREGYKAIAAWHEIPASFPSIDALYTVNPSVTDEGNIVIAVRTRKSWSGKLAYAYVDVFAWCQLMKTT